MIPFAEIESRHELYRLACVCRRVGDESDDGVGDEHAEEGGEVVLVFVFFGLGFVFIVVIRAVIRAVNAPFVAVLASQVVEVGGEALEDFSHVLTWCGCCDGKDGDVAVVCDFGVFFGPFDIGFHFAADGIFGRVAGVDFVADANAEGEETFKGSGCCVGVR